MVSGIYAIKNKVTGKYYIGCSKHCHKRWKQHKYSLVRGTHHSVKLQRSFNKYGLEAFEFSIIQEVGGLTDLEVMEEEFIQLYQSWANGYNVLKKCTRTKESLNKIRDYCKKPFKIRASELEFSYLEEYCALTGSNESDVVRELLRSLEFKIAEIEKVRGLK